MTKSIKNQLRFYKWAKQLGCDLTSYEPENINFFQPITVGSFKERANEIKNKYNHSFSYPVEYHLKGMATLERFINTKLS